VSGETDLGRIIESLRVQRRDGVFVYATIPPGHPLPDVPLSAMVSEVEGTTVVLNRDVAVGAGVEFEFEAAWLTIETHTSLAAVGVAATVSTALAMKSIPVNIIAGFHHDHLLVPADRADEAVAAIDLIRQQR
jgi:hypothetical protein